MELLGITGGIGMGKSAAGDILRRLGVAVVDTDQLAREVVATGTPGLRAVLAEFGDEYQAADGSLLRAALAKKVFADPAALARLNEILHPRIQAAWRAQVAAWQSAGIARAAITIPLLFEKGYETEFHRIMCIACTADTQRQRLQARGWNEAEQEHRSRAQLPVAVKMQRADGVVWTEGSLAAHQAQWELLLGHPATLFNPAPAA